GEGIELISKIVVDEQIQEATFSLSKDTQANTLLKTLLPYVQIIGFQENIPSINDIFIKLVEENS
ncbi:MAG: DUF4162 domain-containing protein, partial [Thermonemataceae bacterium]|nr:DUF4162 domain-containing protein [Thermonemataceae bacterium]